MSVEVVQHRTDRLQPLRYREHITPVNSGFYVSLRGTFGPNSHLAIAYAAFSYTGKFRREGRNHRRTIKLSASSTSHPSITNDYQIASPAPMPDFYARIIDASRASCIATVSIIAVIRAMSQRRVPRVRINDFLDLIRSYFKDST